MYENELNFNMPSRQQHFGSFARTFREIGYFVFLWGLLSAAGCSDGRNNQTSSELVVAFDGAPNGVDPGQLSSAYATGIVQATYETLFEYEYATSPLKLIPALAEDWPDVSPDGKVLTIEIRKDSVFVDSEIFPGGLGRKVTAEDVATSILRHFDPNSPATSGWLWRDLIEGLADWDGDYERYPSGIEVLGESTIKFRLMRPSTQFVHTLATAYSSVIPVEASQLDLSRRTIGSGPYKLDSISSVRATLSRNMNYPERPISKVHFGFVTEGDEAGRFRTPFIGKVRVEFMEDPVSRWIAFDNGEVDITVLPDQFVNPLTYRNSQNIRAEYLDRLTLNNYIANEILFIRFRMDHPGIGYSPDPVRNKKNNKLRCAIESSIDWNRMNSAFFGREARVYRGIVPPTLPEYQIEYDDPNLNEPLSLVVKDFVESYGELPELSYGLGPSALAAQNFDLLKSMLVANGYQSEKIIPIRYSSFGAMMQGASSGKHLLTQMSWALDLADASDTLQLFYGPNGSPGANIGNYVNQEYDDLFESLLLTDDREHRTKLVKEMEALLRQDCAYTGTITRERTIVSSRRIVAVPNHDAPLIGKYFKYVFFRH